jgi:uncharacterized protein
MNRDEEYRKFMNRKNLVSFTVMVKETDIAVQADKNLFDEARESVLKFRGYIEAFIQRNPGFATSLVPWNTESPAPLIINEMIKAGNLAGVGPMAAVAGAIAEFVGMDLLAHSKEVVVENGGDVFMKLNEPVTIGIYAGKSPLSMKLGLRLIPGNRPLSICTSSGTVGHSLSFGKSDAVCIISHSCALADAAATAIGNRIKSKTDIRTAVKEAGKINGILGAVAIIDDIIGLWGDLDIIPLTEEYSRGKKG